MIYLDKNTFPYCFIEEKKFEWGEPYLIITPIFNLSINPELSDIEYTIEVLGKNNFKDNLEKLYNILLNQEESSRIENLNISITNRELLLNKINSYLDSNLDTISPWKSYYDGAFTESDYLQSIEEDINRILLFDRKEY
ncbi:hypothetical protein GKZ90_0020500 [Flavobacterium sp. MC2016-06]|jgi:hypothetical protein|uniref:hypothetical protein n=1 Tax=Flavobacterium sp. MC2016-06 TaxID=2676308 RepID=UPI0012BB014D|nr:hypothetical protein [Flavobacterium sp. MC2016-06]MBU3860850.1 hypothetical protein [Flavobacterium sp. MC2016-06]